MYDELEDMWTTYRTKRSFAEYLAFWNAADWFNMATCAIVGLNWWWIVLRTQEVSDLVMHIPPHQDPRHIDAAKAVHKEALRVGQLYRNFRLFMVLFVASSILMFFKAFQANPRLNLVTRTIVVATQDLLHFGIVLSSIFLAFVLMGHLIFGLMSPDFATLEKSIDTTFLIFTGFQDTSVLATNEKLSGTLWMWGLVIMMQILLLNMVIVIVFDVYAKVKGEIGDAPTVWQQAHEVLLEKSERAKLKQGLKVASLGVGAVTKVGKRISSKGADLVNQSISVVSVRAPSSSAADENERPVKQAWGEEPVVDDFDEEVNRINLDVETSHQGGSLFRPPPLLSEEKLLACLERKGDLDDSESWDVEKLVDLIGASDLSREQAQALLSNAAKEIQKRDDDEDLVSLSDCCRLIGRVDSNVRELIMYWGQYGFSSK